jgi:hypothetical protein
VAQGGSVFGVTDALDLAAVPVGILHRGRLGEGGDIQVGEPTMPATVIAERIGWERSLTVLRDRVAQLRPVYLPPDPASRTAYVAGEIGQHDFWFPDIELPVGCGQVSTVKQLPVLTMVTSYSPTSTNHSKLPHPPRGSIFTRWQGVSFGAVLTRARA